MCPLLGSIYGNKIGTPDIEFFGRGESVHGVDALELVRKWYQTALSVPEKENPLMGDDLDGVKNRKFLVPLNDSYRLLICGGSWEKPALKIRNENRVFVRRAEIDTKTVILVSIINVILLPGGHNIKRYVDDENSKKEAVKEMGEAMDIKKVFARFKISGPYPPTSSTQGIFIDAEDLLHIFTPLDQPFMDINPDPSLETDPEDWKTFRIKNGHPAYTSGYYACLQLKTPGIYLIDIDGSAPLAGHQEHDDDKMDEKIIDTFRWHLKETKFHNSSRYEIEVKERIGQE